MKARPILAVLFFLASACRSSSADPVSPSLFDGSDLQEVVLDHLPLLSLGGSNPEEAAAFLEIQGARLLPIGELVVADGSTEQLRFFDLRGTHKRTIGGRGHGPGEFQALNWIGLVGSSLFAWDIQVLRLTEFDLDGRVLRTVPFDLGDSRSVRPSIVGAFSDGSLLFRDFGGGPAAGTHPRSEGRDSVSYLLIDPEGTHSRVLLQGPGTEKFYRSQDRTTQRLDLLFGRDMKEAVAGEFLFFGLTDSLVLNRLLPMDQEWLSRSFQWVPRDVREEDIEGERNARAQEAHSQLARTFQRIWVPEEDHRRFVRSVEEGVAEIPARETFPAFGDIIADGQGNLWVSEAGSLLAEHRRWVILNPDLKPIARALLPNDWLIQDIVPPHILSLQRDSLGVELVMLYRLDGYPGLLNTREHKEEAN